MAHAADMTTAVVFQSAQTASEVIDACLVSSGNTVHAGPLVHKRDAGLYALTCARCVQMARGMRQPSIVETNILVAEWRAAAVR